MYAQVGGWRHTSTRHTHRWVGGDSPVQDVHTGEWVVTGEYKTYAQVGGWRHTSTRHTHRWVGGDTPVQDIHTGGWVVMVSIRHTHRWVGGDWLAAHLPGTIFGWVCSVCPSVVCACSRSKHMNS